jgi:hypothetical protein
MELASMLAGEPFSDAPKTACPVIASFLRSYNDLASDADRQTLLECASRVVGSRRPEFERARAERCREVALELFALRPFWRRRCALGCGWRAVLNAAEKPDDRMAWKVTAWSAAWLMGKLPDGSARAVALVDELVAMGETPMPELPAAPEPVTAGAY